MAEDADVSSDDDAEGRHARYVRESLQQQVFPAWERFRERPTKLPPTVTKAKFEQLRLPMVPPAARRLETACFHVTAGLLF